MLMINHKNSTSQLVGYELGSRKLSRDLLKEFQKLHYYPLLVTISQPLAKDNVAYYNPLWIQDIFEEII